MTRAVETLVLVEADTSHPLLGLLGLQVEGLANAPAATQVRASSRDEWAQEARKLELQGKDEQARAIRDTFLQAKAVPWAPWSRGRDARACTARARPRLAFGQATPGAAGLCVVAWPTRLGRAVVGTGTVSGGAQPGTGRRFRRPALGRLLWRPRAPAAARLARRCLTAPAPPATVCRAQFQGPAAPVRRLRRGPSWPHRRHAADDGGARRQSALGRRLARARRRPAGCG